MFKGNFPRARSVEPPNKLRNLGTGPGPFALCRNRVVVDRNNHDLPDSLMRVNLVTQGEQAGIQRREHPKLR